MTLNEIIEKLRKLKSDLDSAFELGKIDLDKISAGLGEAAVDLELWEKAPKPDNSIAQNERLSDSFLMKASKMQTIDVTDYR